MDHRSRIVWAVGDIGDCSQDGASGTAELLRHREGLVLALGDLAYPYGSRTDFKRCFEPAWGGLKARLRAVPGNHEYGTPRAQPFFQHLGPAAGPANRGYYSFNLYGWHVVALNSHVEMGQGSAQARWLQRDLAANKAACTLAFMHLPRFSSGEGGDNASVQVLWRMLADQKVSIFLAGHDHLYERLAPINANGAVDESDGVRSFTVGTGGAKLDERPARLRAGSEKLIAGRWGVLQLTLHRRSYEWSFLGVIGAVLDHGTGQCRH